MTDRHDHMAETSITATYDTRLLKRLLPFSKPYRRTIFFSMLIVFMITLLELALPYITKTAIDRHIVPAHNAETDTRGNIDGAPSRMYRVDLSAPDVGRIVSAHPELFTVGDAVAHIAYEDLAALPPEALKIIRGNDMVGIGVITLLFLGLVLADFVLNFFQKLIMEYTGNMMMHDLRMALFRHIQQLSISFFNRNPVGRLVTRVTNDIQNMHELFTSVVSFIFKDIALLVGITIVLISLNPSLAAISFIVVPVVWYAALRFARKARRVFRILRIKVAEINTRFSETIGGMKVIQLFRHETENYRRFKQLNHENYQAGMEQIQLMAVFMPLIEFLGTAAVAGIVYYGGSRVVDQRLSLGELVAFISYIRMFFRPVRDIAEKYNIVQNAFSSAERIFLILDSDETLPMPGANTGPSLSLKTADTAFTSLEFKNVSFSYVPTEPVLDAVSFRLNAGERIGIVGPTGSGKTTLVNLATRLYDPVSGTVTFNGMDIRRLPPAFYRSKMALVMQDPFLFSGTLRDNILRGAGPVTDPDMVRILSASHCRELVDRSPRGLDTELAEAGASISSGERQLLSIARAFARNPQLIIMDEATSYIDSQTEQIIQAALFNLMQDRTAIVVAHRLATVRQLDRILVMRRGRIIETGNHRQLMSQKGFYYRLHQSGSDLRP